MGGGQGVNALRRGWGSVDGPRVRACFLRHSAKTPSTNLLNFSAVNGLNFRPPKKAATSDRGVGPVISSGLGILNHLQI